MRTPMMLLLLIMAQMSWGTGASAQAPPAPAAPPLILIPTKMQELDKLRIFTGRQAVLSDGTMNAVYDVKVPRAGHTYLNFHVDVASNTGPLILSAGDMRLVRDGNTAAVAPATLHNPKRKSDLKTVATLAYTPFDWFIDTGHEVRGDSLTIESKALVQFTIEVPMQGLDDLALFVLSQRVGTVREIRENIASRRGF